MDVDPEKVAAFVDSLDEYQPTVPDELTQHLMRTSGHDCTDVRLVRLVSLAAQSFVSDVMTDALEIHRRRKAVPVPKLREAGLDPKDRDKMVLTSEDLGDALRDYGVTLRCPLYYLDSKERPGTAAAAGGGGAGGGGNAAASGQQKKGR